MRWAQVRVYAQHARRLLLNNPGWKLLSLAIAAVLWALVATEPQLSTFATVRLEYKDVPTNLEISSEPVDTISLELQGPSAELRSLGERGTRPAVVIDMSGVRPGERTFTIDSRNVKMTRGVRLVRAIPSEVRFRFEPRMERTVPVKVRFTGEGAHGYSVAGASVEPAELEIVGPASRVARVTAAFTDPVDVTNAVGPSEYHVNAFVDDPYIRFQTSPQVKVNVTMVRK
jgi:YbbR domain-containing protein